MLPEELTVSPRAGERDRVVEWLRARRDFRVQALGWTHDQAWDAYTDEYGVMRRVGGTRRVRDVGGGEFELMAG